MYIDWDIIIKIGGVITALTGFFGMIVFIVRWFN